MITIIGGDFTRSWLSLPLSHGIKVKGEKMPVLDPLLSDFWNDGQSEFWWLLDSGASATIMATSSVNAYGAWVADMKHEQFRAANGSRC